LVLSGKWFSGAIGAGYWEGEAVDQAGSRPFLDFRILGSVPDMALIVGFVSSVSSLYELVVMPSNRVLGDWFSYASTTTSSSGFGNFRIVGESDGYVYSFSGIYDQLDYSWSGEYSVAIEDCEPTNGVPEGGSALALFACGLGAVGGVRRLMAKRQRA
jgi:hypothetical protein